MKRLLIILGLFLYLSTGYGQAVVISYADCANNNTRAFSPIAGLACYQSFRTVGNCYLDSVKFLVWGANGAESNGNAYAKLYTAGGEYGVASSPLDSLAISDPVDVSTFSDSFLDQRMEKFTFTGANRIILDSGNYCIGMYYYALGASNVGVGSNNSFDSLGINISCHTGNLSFLSRGGDWTVYCSLDMIFTVYGELLPTPAGGGGQVIIISR